MLKEVGPEISSLEGEYKKLAYDNEFRDKLREHPGMIESAMKLMQKAETEYNPPNFEFQGIVCQWNKGEKIWEEISYRGKPYNPPKRSGLWGRGVAFKEGEAVRDQDTGLELSCLGISKRDFYSAEQVGPSRIDRTVYFKAKIGQETFFIKKSVATHQHGFEEFENTAKAKEALKSLDFVKVIDMKLGYVDKDQSWFISKWKDLEEGGYLSLASLGEAAPDDYIRRVLTYDEQIKIFNGIKPKVGKIKEALREGGVDIGDTLANIFYNYPTGKFILLDVSVHGAEGLNQPERPAS